MKKLSVAAMLFACLFLAGCKELIIIGTGPDQVRVYCKTTQFTADCGEGSEDWRGQYVLRDGRWIKVGY